MDLSSADQHLECITCNKISPIDGCGIFSDPEGHGSPSRPILFTYHSHVRIPKDMGIVWEAYYNKGGSHDWESLQSPLNRCLHHSLPDNIVLPRPLTNILNTTKALVESYLPGIGVGVIKWDPYWKNHST